MKRTRLKWIVAVAGISASLAAGTLHAQSEEGSALRLWYQAASLQLKSAIVGDAGGQAGQAASRVNDTASELTAGAKETLNRSASEKSAEVGAKVQATGEAYARQLDEAAWTLGMQAKQERFDPYVVRITEEKSEELERFAESAIAELTKEPDSGATFNAGN